MKLDRYVLFGDKIFLVPESRSCACLVMQNI